MSFTPFARYRNFTLANLKSLLEVYPDMAVSLLKGINYPYPKEIREKIF